MDYDELKGKIKAAFADALPPADDNIVCHDCLECWELRDGVRGRSPDELSDEWVERNFDQLSFFSDNAKRYYFPAFLRAAAFDPDSTVASFVIYALANEFRMQPDGGYSDHQKRAIWHYLAYMEPHADEYGWQEYLLKAKVLWGPGF